jgi:FlaA1/EpsC-like NDP-sugar epimerase
MPTIRTPSIDPAQNRRSLILALIYAGIIVASLHLAYEIRFDFLVPKENQQERLRVLPLVLGVKIVALIAARQFGSMMTYFSVPDLLRLLWAMLASSAVLLLPRLVHASEFAPPRGVVLVDFMCSIGFCSSVKVRKSGWPELEGTEETVRNRGPVPRTEWDLE